MLNIFRISMHMCRGSISINKSKCQDTKAFVLNTSILISHKESFVSWSGRMRWCTNRVFSEYSYVHLRMTSTSEVCLFMSHQALHTFRGISQNIIRTFWLKLSLCSKYFYLKHIEWFSTCFANVLLRYLIVLRRISTSMVLNCIKK